MLQLAIALFGWNLAGAYSRAYFAQDRFKPQTYFGTVLNTTFNLGIISILLVFILRKPLGNLFTFPSQWLWLVPVAALARCVNLIILTHWQVRTKPKQYGLFVNGTTLAETLSSIFLVTVINLNWRGQIGAITLSHLLFVPIGLFIMLREKSIEFTIDKACLKHSLLFGIPLIPHALAGIIDSSVNRIFISKMINVSETGLYTVGYQLAGPILLLATAFNQAYSPWLFKKLNENSETTKRQIVKFTYVYFVIILIASILYGLLAPWLFSFFVGKNFQGAYTYVLWIALGFACNGMYFMVVNYIFYAEKTHYLAIATISTAILNILLNYIFIKHKGAIGAAQATTLSVFINFILVWIISAKLYKMPWNILKK